MRTPGFSGGFKPAYHSRLLSKISKMTADRDFLPLSLFGLGWDFIYFSRVIHGFFSATLIASLIGHLYFALFIKKNWPETKSMVTGRMSLREYLDSHSLPE
jgi:hypothetical protein